MSLTQVANVPWKFTNSAEEVWRVLRGVIAIHKPSQTPIDYVRRTIINNLCKELNEMEVRPPVKYIDIKGTSDTWMKYKLQPSYADHVLVVGPRYQAADFKVAHAYPLTRNMSGLMLFGINYGTKMMTRIKNTNPVKLYRVKGLLGQATDNYFISGKIVEKSTYQSIKRHHIDMLCASYQSSYQKKMFDMCGVDIQSQAAYKLAAQGMIRPSQNQIPVAYSIKCVDFKSPEFTLEVACINDNEMFLKSMIHSLGLQLRSTATCTQMQCIKIGIFDSSMTLLKREWNLRQIIGNIKRMRYVYATNPFMIQQKDPILKEYSKEDHQIV